jgi:solute carrier family 25 protein 38
MMQESNSYVPAFFIPTAYAAGIHSFSAASAGAIATMATHPFDVVKVISSGCLSFQNI